MASYLLFGMIKKLASGCYPYLRLLSCALPRVLAAVRHSREIRMELMNIMNRNQIEIIRVNVEDAGENALLQQLLFADYDPYLTSPAGIYYEDVEVAYTRTINEDDEYFGEIFVTEEEKQIPKIIAALVLIYYSVVPHARRRAEAGRYVTANAQLDSEPAFEEPPIE